MKINYNNAFTAIIDGTKIPRKAKKHLLGKILGKNQLRKLLSSVRVVNSAETMYDRPEILPYEFCPKCGCRLMKGGGNLTSHPEHWEYFHCMRCHNVVGYIDNSAFTHALECADNNYNPVF